MMEEKTVKTYELTAEEAKQISKENAKSAHNYSENLLEEIYKMIRLNANKSLDYLSFLPEIVANEIIRGKEDCLMPGMFDMAFIEKKLKANGFFVEVISPHISTNKWYDVFYGGTVCNIGWF